MYRYEEIRTVHLELSTKCNASCPQCPRNVEGGPLNPYLPLGELSLSDVKKIFPEPFVKQLSTINMCGNYGDPILCSDLHEISRYFRSANPDLELTMHTNGGARNVEWWAKLASLVTECTFGIDGLEGTNHIYRRNTRWKAVTDNAQAFINAGGMATWNYLVFEHNQHEVMAAVEVARRMGFQRFFIKKTSRFLKGNEILNETPIRNSKGRIVRQLKLATDPSFINLETIEISKQYSTKDRYISFLNQTPIQCKAVTQKRIFVSAQGFIIPCCWLGSIYSKPIKGGRVDQFKVLVERSEESFFNLSALHRTIKEIVEGPLFQTEIPSAWSPNSPDRLKTCSLHCGAHKISRGQKNASLI